MRSIYKFKVGVVADVIDLPVDARIVSVHEQDDAVCMWVLATWDGSVPKRSRNFTLLGTGHPVPNNFSYVGTAHLPKFGLVMHVFEVIK